MQTTILPQNPFPWQSDEWQKRLSGASSALDQLSARIDVSNEDAIKMQEVDRLFAVKAPLEFLENTNMADWSDPVVRQVAPSPHELDSCSGFTADPLGEEFSRPLPGLLHKYHGRVLIIVTSACAIHCRYCFRRHFPYSDNQLSREQWADIHEYIANDNTIQEVILSGGDPLSMKTEYLKRQLEPLLTIPHVRKLRFHTRLPVVIPERVDEKLLDWFSEIKQQIVMVVHANHATELSKKFSIAMQGLRLQGVHLLNQSVLLQGVNDKASILADLSERLFQDGVMPYYLHLLDRVVGAAHFEVQKDEAEMVYKQLLKKLPGYLVPKLVREQQGEPSKTPVGLMPIE